MIGSSLVEATLLLHHTSTQHRRSEVSLEIGTAHAKGGFVDTDLGCSHERVFGEILPFAALLAKDQD